MKKKSFVYFLDVHEFLEDIILNFVNLVESSTPKYNEAKLISQHLSNVDLTEDLLMVEKSLHTARNLSQFIGNISQEVKFDKTELSVELIVVKSYRSSASS